MEIKLKVFMVFLPLCHKYNFPGPQRRHFFFCSAYDHTRLHWLHLTQPWLYWLLVLTLTMRSIHWPPQQLGSHVLSSCLPWYACRLFKWTTWDCLECALTLLDTWCPWPAPLFQMVPPTVNGISLLHLVSAVECMFAKLKQSWSVHTNMTLR